MDFSLLFPVIILMLGVPLFLSSRKQKRQAGEMQALQAALEPGDIVSTTSGLRGTVVDASYEDTIDLEIADGVVTTWVRAAIREKIVAAEPAVEVAPVVLAHTTNGPSLTKGDAGNEPVVPDTRTTISPGQPVIEHAATEPAVTEHAVTEHAVTEHAATEHAATEHAVTEHTATEVTPVEVQPTAEQAPVEARIGGADDAPNGSPRS